MWHPVHQQVRIRRVAVSKGEERLTSVWAGEEEHGAKLLGKACQAAGEG